MRQLYLTESFSSSSSLSETLVCSYIRDPVTINIFPYVIGTKSLYSASNDKGSKTIFLHCDASSNNVINIVLIEVPSDANALLSYPIFYISFPVPIWVGKTGTKESRIEGSHYLCDKLNFLCVEDMVYQLVLELYIFIISSFIRNQIFI